MCSIQLRLACEDETLALAQKLAPWLGAGDVVLLEGPIGAGKSFFARALILSLLPTPEDIPSPTFTLVQSYDAGRFDIWHCDLYRLSSSFEAQELGLEDAFETALCLIEWPDRLTSLTPQNALTIELQTTDIPDERLIRFSATDPRWAEILERLNGA